MDLEQIPEKHRALVKEALDISGAWRATKDVAKAMAPYTAGMMLAAGTAGLSGYFAAKRRYEDSLHTLRQSHLALTGHPEFKKDPQVYTERFKELSLISPTIASNPTLAHKIIVGRLEGGFTVDDIHRMSSIEHMKSQTYAPAHPGVVGVQQFAKAVETALPLALPAAFDAYDRRANLEGHYRDALREHETKTKMHVQNAVEMASKEYQARHRQTLQGMQEAAANAAAEMAGTILNQGNPAPEAIHNRLKDMFKVKLDKNFSEILTAMEKEKNDMEKKSSDEVTLRVSEECMGRMLATRYSMYKEAGVITGAKGMMGAVTNVLKSSGNATKDYLKLMAVPLAIGIGFNAVSKMMQAKGNRDLHEKADRVFAGLVRSSDVISENREVAADAFDSLKSFAPLLAVKPMVAKTFVEHVVQSGGRLGVETAGMLADTQSKIQEVTEGTGRPGTGFFAGLKDPMAAFSVKMPGMPNKKE